MAELEQLPEDQPLPLIYWKWRLSTLLVAITLIAAHLAIARWNPPLAIVAAGAVVGILAIVVTNRRYNLASRSRYGTTQFHAAGVAAAATSVTVGALTGAMVLGLFLFSSHNGVTLPFTTLLLGFLAAIALGLILGMAEGVVIAAGYLALKFLFLDEYYVKREDET